MIQADITRLVALVRERRRLQAERRQLLDSTPGPERWSHENYKARADVTSQLAEVGRQTHAELERLVPEDGGGADGYVYVALTPQQAEAAAIGLSNLAYEGLFSEEAEAHMRAAAVKLRHAIGEDGDDGTATS